MSAPLAALLAGLIGYLDKHLTDTQWTILAPTNKAFDTTLTSMGLNTSTLLNPSNRALTTAILSYHIIPSGAYTTANFTDGMAVSTLLPGAGELTVKVSSTDVTFTTPDQVSATVITRDIMAGRCVVHVIDNVLLPSLSMLLSQPDSGTVDETTEAGGGGAKGGHWEGVYVPRYVPPPPAPAGRDGINSPPAPSYISGSSQASTYVPSMTDIPSVSTLLTDRKVAEQHC